ncbi:MAG: GTP 3',8-cyclase MoaA [Desulfovibrionaceae bacterium]|nr:GTP 3',8-cyclase MoaA [Desulfovibrionaceae bacterium]
MDAHGRTVSYVRVSVTDRCNLRCQYCVCDNPTFTPHEDILRYEEIAALIARLRAVGVEKVRLTGGEPFVRKGFAAFVERLLAADPGLDLRITTNATLLEPHVERLAAAGVRRINISLDTLDRAAFARVTGRDLLDHVLRAVEACLGAGIRVKINAVAMRDVNLGRMADFLHFIRTRPVDMRFIELMPVGHGAQEGRWCSGEEILEAAREHAELTPVPRARAATTGPATLYDLRGHAGRLGVITPVSSHFCATCNRLRITSDGRLRTCLFSDRTYRLRPILRHPHLGLEQVVRVVRLAGASKPIGFNLLQQAFRDHGGDHGVCTTGMSSIGG